MIGPLVVRRVLAVAAFALAVALPLVPAQQAGGKRYAVLVGINKYEHDKLEALQFAENDASEMAQLLGGKGYEVTLLVGSAKDEAKRPTKAVVDAALKQVLRGCKAGDTVLIGLAGHGLQFGETKDAFFCPIDARPFADEEATMVSLGQLYKDLEKSFAGSKVLLVDACRNDPLPGRGSRGIDADNAPRPPQGVAALFSCRAGEKAWEHESLKHGVFFHHVLEGLRGKARDTDNEVTFAGLAANVTRRVNRAVAELYPGAKQSPNLKADYSNEPVLLTVAATDSAPPTPRPLKTDDPKGGKEIVVDLGGGVKMEFVRIQGDTFEMGDLHDGAKNAPRHTVEISTFYLGKTEVTQEQYQAITKENPSWFRATGGGKDSIKGLDTSKFPVDSVSWKYAKEYCDTMTEKFGRGGRKFRLPTEAEWEFACRAGTKTRFHSGDAVESLKDYAWYFDNAEGITHKVGTKAANAFGLHDMQGNVCEWCADWYDEGYYAKSDKKILKIQ